MQQAHRRERRRRVQWAVATTALAAVASWGCAPGQGHAGREGTDSDAAEAATPSPASLWSGPQAADPSLRVAYVRAIADRAGPAYRFEPDDGGRVVAANRAQDLAVEVGPERVRLAPRDSKRWWFELWWAETGRGAIGSPAPPATTAPETHDNRVAIARSPAGTEEWYLNGPLGLEQGFELAERPAGQGELWLRVGTAGLTPVLGDGGSHVLLVDEGGQPLLRYADLLAWDAAGELLPSRLAIDGGAIELRVDDRGASYPLHIDPLMWVEQDKLLPTPDGTGEEFGYSVAHDGDTALVGAPYGKQTSTGVGIAYVFVRSAGAWSEQQRLAPEDGGGNWFGRSVALDGDTALIGAIFDNTQATNAGAAYVFVRSATTWSQEAKLLASDGADFDFLGHATSIHADTAVATTYYGSGNPPPPGAAYVFVRSATTWSEQQKLTPSNPTPNDRFAYSAAVHGDTVLVGAYYGSSTGAVYAFDRSGGVWTEAQILTPSDGAGLDEFGTSVCLQGDTAIVGSHTDDDVGINSGSAYVFGRWGGTWVEEQKLVASDGADQDRFGTRVSLDGDTAAVGASYHDSVDTNAGAAYVFHRSGGFWMQQGKLVASDGAATDLLGSSVAVAGDVAIAGAHLSDSDGAESGAAYAYVRTGTSWSEEAKLVPSGTAMGDSMGCSVAVFGDTAIVGAIGDSEAAGTAGAAYVFVSSGATWQLEQKIIASDATSGDQFGYAVTLDDDEVIISAYAGGPASAGAAYAFVRTGSVWNEQQKLLASDGVSGDRFGASLVLDGDTALIGAPEDDDGVATDSGSAYVFGRSASTWSEIQQLSGSDTDSFDEFGTAVALDGDEALIGAPRAEGLSNNPGAAYAFVRSANSFGETQKLLASDNDHNDFFGHALDLDGDTALIGAYSTSTGSVYVFEKVGPAWLESQKLGASDPASSDQFGWALSLYGDAALIGARSDDDLGSNSGSAYLFTRTGTSFAQFQKIVPSDGAAEDWFGHALSLHDNIALVGAYPHDALGEDSGAAYVFRNGKATGSSCALPGECGSGYCADAICCGQVCDGICEACANALTGQPDGQCAPVSAGTDPDGNCGAGQACDGLGSCKLLLGEGCVSGDLCVSGYCTDGVCCDTECGALCTACTAAKTNDSDGICAFIPTPTDPDDECGLGDVYACNGAGECKKPDGQLCTDSDACINGACVNGFCCDQPCAAPCMACSAVKTGNDNGQCHPVLAGNNIDGDCPSGQACDGAGGCGKEIGQGCNQPDECLSGFCVDGYCCDQPCGTCRACSQAKTGGTDGFCEPVAAGDDPDDDCPTDPGFPHSCGPDGACDGTGTCRPYALSDVQCSAAYCENGLAYTTSYCNGAGSCQTPAPVSCAPHTCGAETCQTSCTSDADCVAPSLCENGVCVQAIRCDDNGHTLVHPDGTVVDCSPHRCTEAGICANPCESSADCVPGTICGATGQCQTLEVAGPEDGCSCRLGAQGSAHNPWLAASALAAWISALRQRRRGRRL